MKNYLRSYFYTMFFGIIGILILCNPAFAQETMITAAVVDLEAKEGISQGVVSTISDYLRTQLVNTNKFTIVTRENMEQILKEQNFQMSGCTSQECIVQVGQLLGVREMFTGSIGKVGTTYVINLKIINVETGKIEKAEAEMAYNENQLLPATENLARKMAGLPTQPLTESVPQSPAKTGIPSQQPVKTVSPGWLGVHISNINDKLAKSFGLASKEGALVVGVFRNSPAEKSGIKRGDVIVGCNGKKVKDISELISILHAIPIGEKASLGILRGGKEITVEAMLEKTLPEESASFEKFGLEVTTTTDGVLITRIKEGTFAGNREVEIYDIIKKINNEEVKYAPDFKSEIEKAGLSAQLLVERGNITKSVSVSRIEKVGIGIFFPFQEVQNGNYIPGFTLKFPDGGYRFDFSFKPVKSVEFDTNYRLVSGNLIDVNFFGADIWFTKGAVIPYFSIADNICFNFGTQTIGSYGYWKMGLGIQAKLGLEIILADSIGIFAEGGGGFNLFEFGQYKNSNNAEEDFDGFFSSGYYTLNFGTNLYF